MAVFLTINQKDKYHDVNAKRDVINYILNKVLPLVSSDFRNQHVILYNLAANFYKMEEYEMAEKYLNYAVKIEDDLETQILESFIDLKPGDYVVHIHHGVGQFTGIERVKSQGVEKDYIGIIYADDDKVFIPIEQMNFIQKYISGDVGDKPRLDKIGGKNWSKTKNKVKESVNKLAGELVRLYSYRLNQRGFAFAPDTPWQKEFEAKFPYDETEDQILTIEEVKRDMESSRPMDRLICGDVGFGKTDG